MSRKVVVFEVVCPLLDGETIAQGYEQLKDEIPLHAFLGQVTNEVVLTAIYLDNDDEEVLEAHKGYIVRTRISDEEWVKMTSDRANFEGIDESPIVEDIVEDKNDEPPMEEV